MSLSDTARLPHKDEKTCSTDCTYILVFDHFSNGVFVLLSEHGKSAHLVIFQFLDDVLLICLWRLTDEAFAVQFILHLLSLNSVLELTTNLLFLHLHNNNIIIILDNKN